jgi:hypothetical protein
LDVRRQDPQVGLVRDDHVDIAERQQVGDHALHDLG